MNVFTNFTSFTSPTQSPKVSVFDFVAWMHLQVLQAPSKVPNACLWFCSMSSFTRFYKFQGNYPLQNQGYSLSPSLTTTESKSNGSKEKLSYGNDITTESRIWIPHLTSLYKIKNPYMLGKKGFRGTILYRIKVIPSYHLSPLHNQDLKIWHWGACFTRKSKTLGCRQPYFYKISSMTKM
jgi:hypothetical protein